MAMIVCRCPSCRELLEVPSSRKGQPEQCPKCAVTFLAKPEISPVVFWCAISGMVLAVGLVGILVVHEYWPAQQLLLPRESSSPSTLPPPAQKVKLVPPPPASPPAPPPAATPIVAVLPPPAPRPIASQPAPASKPKPDLIRLNAAIARMDAFQAHFEIGMNYRDYSQALGDLWAAVRPVVESPTVDEKPVAVLIGGYIEFSKQALKQWSTLVSGEDLDLELRFSGNRLAWERMRKRHVCELLRQAMWGSARFMAIAARAAAEGDANATAAAVRESQKLADETDKAIADENRKIDESISRTGG
jgi:hypothetical protein